MSQFECTQSNSGHVWKNPTLFQRLMIWSKTEWNSLYNIRRGAFSIPFKRLKMFVRGHILHCTKRHKTRIISQWRLLALLLIIIHTIPSTYNAVQNLLIKIFPINTKLWSRKWSWKNTHIERMRPVRPLSQCRLPWKMDTTQKEKK